MSLTLQVYRDRIATYQIDLIRDGLPFSLDGQTLIFSVGRLHDLAAGSVALRKISGVNITHEPVPGRAKFTITMEEASSLDPLVTYFCDVALVDDITGIPVNVDGLNGTLTPISVAGDA